MSASPLFESREGAPLYAPSRPEVDFLLLQYRNTLQLITYPRGEAVRAGPFIMLYRNSAAFFWTPSKFQTSGGGRSPERVFGRVMGLLEESEEYKRTPIDLKAVRDMLELTDWSGENRE